MEFGEPPPKHNDLPSMHDLVIQDMDARKRFGLEKYGTLLQPFNGRNALKDAYEEILDLAVYLRQKLYEQEQEAAVVAKLAEEATKSTRVHVPTAEADVSAKDVAVDVDNPSRCYCGGPEEQVYGHVYGKGRWCRERVEGGK